MTVWPQGSAAAAHPRWWRPYARPVFLVLACVSVVEAVGLWKPGQIGLVAPALLGVYQIFKGMYPFRTRVGKGVAGLARVGCMIVPYAVFTWILHPQMYLQGLSPICDGADFATPPASSCITSEQAQAWNHELVAVWVVGLLAVEAVVALAAWRGSRRTV